ncbi:hypothetical protein [Saccharothrix sp. NRRL B-16314]|uniref:hypothetical protein n=1 Tax=Saccharothrix sp. NRRL B-16314 TaxID=1463825 RepID=UPI0012DC2F67|nr:hypothetical protein [Saccharothrix sp. NRRL B-16314]
MTWAVVWSPSSTLDHATNTTAVPTSRPVEFSGDDGRVVRGGQAAGGVSPAGG